MLDQTTLLPDPATVTRPRRRSDQATWRRILPQRTTALVRAVFSLSAILAEALMIVVAASAAELVYHGALLDPAQMLDPVNYADPVNFGLVIAVLYIVPRVYRNEYAISHYLSMQGSWGRSFTIWNVAFVSALAIAFITKTTAAYSRGSIILFYVSGWAAVMACRAVFVRAVLERTRNGGVLAARRVFLVGLEETIEAFSRLYEPWDFGVQVVAGAVLRPGSETLEEDLALAAASARMIRPDDVFILEPWSRHDTIEACLNAFLRVPASIHLGPERFLDRFVDAHISKVGPLASLEIARRPLTTAEIVVKRLFDIVATSAAIVVLSPILLACAIAIKLDSPGPVFYLQRRYGFNQEPFRIFKFRSMTTLDEGRVIVQASKNDKRITRVGRWLRRFNLDELPQLFNVLRGDMSLVGPRPHALAHDQHFERRIALYARRHNVRPGITGWAQVNGFRGETDTVDKMRARVEHDLYYIDNWSLWLDLKIVAMTVISPKAYRNAH